MCGTRRNSTTPLDTCMTQPRWSGSSDDHAHNTASRIPLPPGTHAHSFPPTTSIYDKNWGNGLGRQVCQRCPHLIPLACFSWTPFDGCRCFSGPCEGLVLFVLSLCCCGWLWSHQTRRCNGESSFYFCCCRCFSKSAWVVSASPVSHPHQPATHVMRNMQSLNPTEKMDSFTSKDKGTARNKKK